MFKKALSVVLVAAISATAAVGGTLAYLQSEDSDVNVMTLGNVDIEQLEYQRAEGVPHINTNAQEGDLVPFVQDQPLYPAVPTADDAYEAEMAEDRCFHWGVYSPGWNGLWDDSKLANVMDKFVFVENTGKSDAYYRTLIALECPEGMTIGYSGDDEINVNINGNSRFTWDYSVGYVTINGTRYEVWGVTYNEILKPDEVSRPSLLQVVMTHNATNEDMELLGDTYEILVLSQAVQVDGFENATQALNAAFGEVTAENAAKWFGDMKVPVVAPADAVAVTSQTTYEEFADLLAGGKNIHLTEDVTIANPESSRFTKFTLNGEIGIWSDEGKTLTFSETTTLVGDGKLTVYTGSIDEKQELCVAENATIAFEGGEHSFNAFSASSNGKIVVNGGVLNCKGTYAGIMGITFAENGQLIVNGGKINLYQPINLNQNRCDKAYVEINGGTVELLNDIENLFVVRNVMDKDQTSGVLRGSSIRVKGGTFIAHYEIDSAGDATSFIRNGDAPADGNKVLVSNAADKYDCAVTGGTFYGSWQRADNTRYTDGNGGYSDGLMVDNSIAGFIADGYRITGDADNGYVVSAK